MATSMIKTTSVSLISDGFVSNNANVTITSQRSLKLEGGQLANTHICFTVSSELPKYTSLLKANNQYSWFYVDAYNFADNDGHLFNRHGNRNTGIQNMTVLPAGEYRIELPY